MAQRQDKTGRFFILFAVISLLLHLGIFAFFYAYPLYYSERQPSIPPPPRQDVVFVRPQDMISGPPASAPLVDLAKPKVQKRPDKAKFVSPYDSTVKEETVAKKIPKKARPDVEVSEAPERKKPPKAKAKSQSAPKKVAKKPAALPSLTDTSPWGKTGESTSKDLSLSDLQVRPSDFKDLMGDLGKSDKPKKSLEKAEKSTGVDKDEERIMAALPRDSGLGDKFVHDFMPGVKIGDKTYLNTAAMPNVQYFTRLKRIFRLRFNPRDPLISHFRHNRLVVGKVNVTMAVEVTQSGNLYKLFVVRSSGIPGYDQEALQTIRLSAPFSAPPKAIQGKDGILRMTWHFTTYL